MIRAVAVALAASALSACVVLPEEPPPPPPCGVTVDGVLTVAEWQGAQRIDLSSDAATLWLIQTSHHVCFAAEIRQTGAKYVDVFLVDRAGVARNLHASMQVGERVLPDRRWTDQEPPTQWGQTTGWTANVAVRPVGALDEPPEYVEPFDGYEFVIDRAQLSPWRIRIEVRDFDREVRDIVWPAQSRRTDIATWAVLP